MNAALNKSTYPLLLAVVAIGGGLAQGQTSQPADPCAQPSPREMAERAGVSLPPRPWHVADIWWDFDKPTEHFQRLDIDVTIDRDVPSTYNLYVAPCGIAKINDLQFYGGLQTNINGWPSKESRQRVFPGKGSIFSRWSADKKTPIGLDHARPAENGLVESAGYEGEFASVRRPLVWGAGKYTYQVVRGESQTIDDKTHTWFQCRVRDPQGLVHEIGSLRATISPSGRSTRPSSRSTPPQRFPPRQSPRSTSPSAIRE
jgi:hypothetical protein